ncbi:DnaJ family domain-containing protein [Paenibacillus cisolokensis]|uniref:DnaJ family domain-containing protein n=1 Tax=Paenibacillus TaxID=44249 RepID=UPI0007208429|nr:DnaJ family domain-containing protein [Paenibacillus sp. 32O-W]ALS27663.1 molecular chaperone DnaJ [Paenibacillus sp. 32O-W]
MDFFSQLVEERIAEARRKGEFDNLQGAGKPLELEDLSHIPEELRVGYKLLKNSGYVPEEVQLAKELIALQDLIAMCEQDDERRKLSKQLSEKRLRLRLLGEQRGWGSLAAFGQYEKQIRERLEGADQT